MQDAEGKPKKWDLPCKARSPWTESRQVLWVKCAPPTLNSYVEILTHNVMVLGVFGDRTFKEVMKVK